MMPKSQQLDMVATLTNTEPDALAIVREAAKEGNMTMVLKYLDKCCDRFVDNDEMEAEFTGYLGQFKFRAYEWNAYLEIMRKRSDWWMIKLKYYGMVKFLERDQKLKIGTILKTLNKGRKK
jgi:hypothetical protein